MGRADVEANKHENLERMKQAVPLGRVGTPMEVAHAGLFLASDEASYITGVSLPADGGYTGRGGGAAAAGVARILLPRRAHVRPNAGQLGGRLWSERRPSGRR